MGCFKPLTLDSNALCGSCHQTGMGEKMYTVQNDRTFPLRWIWETQLWAMMCAACSTCVCPPSNPKRHPSLHPSFALNLSPLLFLNCFLLLLPPPSPRENIPISLSFSLIFYRSVTLIFPPCCSARVVVKCLVCSGEPQSQTGHGSTD